MRSVALYLPAIACAAMMLFMCMPMMLGRKHAHGADAASKEEVAQLREEVARLKADRPSQAEAEV